MELDSDLSIEIEEGTAFSLLSAVAAQLDGDDESASLQSALATAKKTVDARANQKKDAAESLRQLSLALENAKTAANEAAAQRTLTKQENAAKVAVLEDQQYIIGKKIHEHEKSVTSLEATKRHLLIDLEQLKAKEAAEAALPPDESLLKLNIYKSLGIDLVYNENQEVIRCLVRSVEKNGITPVEMEGAKFSDFFYSNVLWEMMSC
ncbi:kinetochore-associated Ndc80 complex subunit spc24 [Rhizoclosmatium sp. JEL0117]|nr:kinetochore-associated Ndc80 complex subunit spc24 [Rhizoclosmatium sp. JEL0117]